MWSFLLIDFEFAECVVFYGVISALLFVCFRFGIIGACLECGVCFVESGELPTADYTGSLLMYDVACMFVV